jgi:hypothetical protein
LDEKLALIDLLPEHNCLMLSVVTDGCVGWVEQSETQQRPLN